MLKNHILEQKSLILDLAAEIQSKVAHIGVGHWQCTVCSYQSPKKCNVTEHVEAKHVVHPGYECSACHRVYPHKQSFRSHKRYCRK